MIRSRNTSPLIARLTAAMLLAASFCFVSPAQAWHDDGHFVIAFESVVRLPDDVPSFFRAGAPTVGHMSIDPDVARHESAPQLRAAEAPEHYIDLELLEGAPLPATRYEYIALCNELDVNPKYAGMLPYAIIEWTQRLTLAFAEHRQWPDDPAIRSKCLIYAGMLSHYSADLCMPLHTTIHYDGMADENNKSPHTGIHAKVDALLGKWPDAQWATLRTPDPVAVGNTWTFILGELARSHDRVPLVYQLESQLPEVDQPIGQSVDLQVFIFESAHRATSVTSQLFYTAWQNSAKIKLDPAHDRSIEQEPVDAAALPLPDIVTQPRVVAPRPSSREASEEAAIRRPDFDTAYDDGIMPPARTTPPSPQPTTNQQFETRLRMPDGTVVPTNPADRPATATGNDAAAPADQLPAGDELPAETDEASRRDDQNDSSGERVVAPHITIIEVEPPEEADDDVDDSQAADDDESDTTE